MQHFNLLISLNVFISSFVHPQQSATDQVIYDLQWKTVFNIKFIFFCINVLRVKQNFTPSDPF